MADIEGLKQRIELIDLRLKTAHSARERESAALMEMWGQIRDRFQQQNSEIVELRNRIVALEDTRNDLQNMVDSLLGSVENGLERMSDETVPRIREMALGLLDKEPLESANQLTQSDLNSEGYPSFDLHQGDAHDSDFLAELERSMVECEECHTESGETERRGLSASDSAIDPPVSSGIRDLIARIGNPIAPAPPPAHGGIVDHSERSGPEGLSRDLLEIEHLRNELLGLRTRISHSG